MVTSPAWDPDAGWEQPEGRVVAPGRYTLVWLDKEFAEFQDERLIEVKEDYLVLIVEMKMPELSEGGLSRRQAGS